MRRLLLLLVLAPTLALAQEEAPPDAPEASDEEPLPEPPELPEAPPSSDAPEGTEGGVVGGVVGGTMGGTLGKSVDGVDVVHWSQIKVKRRVAPKYPEAAKAMNLESQCLYEFVVDEKGSVESVTPRSCPKVFHASCEEALTKWSFYPYKEDGVAQKASFVLKIDFMLHGPPPEELEEAVQAATDEAIDRVETKKEARARKRLERLKQD